MKNCFDAYDVLSAAYREHLEIAAGIGVVFSDAIMKRIREVESGAEKKEASKLKAALDEIRKQQPRYTTCGFYQLCEALVQVESLGV